MRRSIGSPAGFGISLRREGLDWVMQKPAQLRAVFAELRAAVGAEVSGGDLIRLAHLILKSYQFEEESGDHPEIRLDSRAFSALAVDEAMADGGWRVLAFEAGHDRRREIRERPSVLDLRLRVGKYLGAEWRTRIPPG